MSLLSFYSRNSAELLGLIWQHVYLVAVSTGAAIVVGVPLGIALTRRPAWRAPVLGLADRKSTRLNSSHLVISYAVFCLKKKKRNTSSLSHDVCISSIAIRP